MVGSTELSLLLFFPADTAEDEMGAELIVPLPTAVLFYH